MIPGSFTKAEDIVQVLIARHEMQALTGYIDTHAYADVKPEQYIPKPASTQTPPTGDAEGAAPPEHALTHRHAAAQSNEQASPIAQVTTAAQARQSVVTAPCGATSTTVSGGATTSADKDLSEMANNCVTTAPSGGRPAAAGKRYF